MCVENIKDLFVQLIITRWDYNGRDPSGIP
jgi:hypothetical protein